MSVRIELDLCSGRVNPSVELGDEAEAELRRRLKTLRRRPARGVVDPPGLGYRGIEVRAGANPDPPEVEPSAPIFVYGGTALQGAAVLTDPGRNLERWLLQTLDERLEPGLRPAIQQILQEL